jgi:hypothetical protein
MKTSLVNFSSVLLRPVTNLSVTIFHMLLVFLIFSGLLAHAQNKPEVYVRFDNPQYECPTQTYCLDVQFMSDTPNQKLFGMNVRFYYDDDILEYIGTGDFAQGYSMPVDPEITAGNGGVFFGFAGPPEWVNGQVQLTSTTPVVLPTDGWVKLFRICFHVDDPNSLSIQNFCPSIVWDLQEDPPEIGGGFQPGDDGVVITLASQTPGQSIASTENVVQFNWEYGGNPGGYGHPVSIICISTICGYIIPVSNWSLFLAFGLMLFTSLFIWRRRML